MPIGSDFTIDQINKTIKHTSGSTVYTVNELYSYLQDTFDEVTPTETIRYDIPMSAQTPTEYTLINSWFIDEVSFQYLKTGAIATSGWDAATNNEGIRVFTFGGTYTNAVSGDIGKPVAYSGGTPTDSGTLLDYNNTLKKWWVRVDDTGDTFSNTSTAVVITGGTGTGVLSVASATGEAQFSNIFTLGTLVSGTTLDVYQNDTQITPWWSSGQIDVLVKVKEAGSEIDTGNLTVLARKYGTLYDHFVIDASTGRNPVPLAAFDDPNNDTSEGGFGGAPYTSMTFSFGAKSRDLSNGNGVRPYDVEINAGGGTLLQLYEYLKYVTRTGSGTTLNGVNGEFYTAVGDIRFDYNNEGGGGSAFNEGELITGTGGGTPTGYLVSLIDNGTTGTMVLRNVHGTFTNGQAITGGTTGRTANVNSVPDPITQVKAAPFGTLAGGVFFGARGVWITNYAASERNSFHLYDSTNTLQDPPRVVDITITVKDESGTVISGAQVAVYKNSDSSELLNTTTNGSGIATTTFNYVSDTAVTIRVRKSSAAPKYVPVNTSGTIVYAGLSVAITFVSDSIAAGTTNGTIAGDFTINTTTKTIRHTADAVVYTANDLYTWLMDEFDASGFMDDTTPISAQTPTEYTLTNGWFMDDTSVEFLKSGAIQTSGWTHPTNTTGIRILTLATITGVDDSDLGTAVAGVTTGDTGILLAYNTTLKKLWVRTDAADDDFNNTSETINVNGSGAGAMGGTVAVTGETIWSNIFTLGTLVSGTTLDLYQNDTQITPWWSSGQIDVLVKVKEAGTEIDTGNLTVLARKYGTLYDHFVIDASSGRNPVPLAAFDDTNNDTAEGTVGAAPYTNITITFGATSQDLSNGNGARPYDVSINCATLTLTQVYEYLKYVTRTGSSTTLNGVNGEYYTAVGDIRFNYDNEGGGGSAFNEGELITGTGGGTPTGYLVSLIDNGTTGTMVLRNVHGTFTDDQTITGGTTGRTALVNGTPEAITQVKAAPFGTFAGGKLFGARGVWIYNMASADAQNYQLIDSTATSQSPPVVVPITITVKDEAGSVVSGAQVAVYKVSDSSELLNTTSNGSGIASTTFNYSVDTAVVIRVRKSSAAPKYVPVNTSGTITVNGLTATITFVAEAIAAGTTNGTIAGDFTINTTTKTIRHTADAVVYTANDLYTWLMDVFDASGYMQYTTPISAQTPTEYTLTNGWFMDNASFKYISGGAIQTSGQASYIVHILTVTSGTYNDPVSGDITKTVVAGATSIGPLLDYEIISAGVSSKWYVRDTRGSPAVITSTTAMTITTGTGSGNNSVNSLTGENIWSNIFTLGTLVSGTTLDVYQNDTQITPWWSSGQIDVLVKVKEAGTEIDTGNLTVLARKYGTLYDHFVIDASSGRNPVPLAAFDDTNNDTAEGTVGAAPYTNITITFGAVSRNLNNGNGPQPYDVEIDCAGLTILQVYEYLKYVTRTGSSTTLNGVNGEFYTAVGDIRLNYTGESSGPFVEGNAITSSAGGSGYIVSLIDNGTTGTLVIRNVHGTFADTNTLTSSGTTATISGAPEAIAQSKQSPFGTFAGGKFFGARGVWITDVTGADANKYQLIDSTGTTQSPPSTIAITVNSVVSGDQVSVFRTTGDNEIINKSVYTSHASSNTSGAGTFTVTTAIASDTPTSGSLRVVNRNASGNIVNEQSYSYASWTGSVFTLTGGNLTQTYDSDDTAYVPYIDATASGTSVSVTVSYTADRYVVTRVRKKGIVPFTVKGQLTNANLTITAIRTSDSIVS